MRILIDTNVLISAALNVGETPFRAYVKAVTYPNHGLICEQNIEELNRIFNKKFPTRVTALDHFYSTDDIGIGFDSAGSKPGGTQNQGH